MEGEACLQNGPLSLMCVKYKRVWGNLIECMIKAGISDTPPKRSALIMLMEMDLTSSMVKDQSLIEHTSVFSMPSLCRVQYFLWGKKQHKCK